MWPWRKCASGIYCDCNGISHSSDAAVTDNLQSSPANSLWEKLMLKKHSSGSGNRVIRLYDAAGGKEVHVGLNNNSAAAHDNLARAVRPDVADLNLRPAVMPKATKADRQTSLLSLLFTVLMEGFAFWGASLYPISAFPIEAVTESETTQKKRSSS